MAYPLPPEVAHLLQKESPITLHNGSSDLTSSTVKRLQQISLNVSIWSSDYKSTAFWTVSSGHPDTCWKTAVYLKATQISAFTDALTLLIH